MKRLIFAILVLAMLPTFVAAQFGPQILFMFEPVSDTTQVNKASGLAYYYDGGFYIGNGTYLTHLATGGGVAGDYLKHDGTVELTAPWPAGPFMISADTVSGNVYGSNGSVSDAELLYINSLTGNVQDTLVAIRGDVETAEATIADHGDTLTSIRSDFETVEALTAVQGDTLIAHRSDIETLETLTSNHSDTLVAIRSDVETLETTASTHGDTLTALRTDIESLEVLTSDHSDTLTSIRSDFETVEALTSVQGDTLISHRSDIEALEVLTSDHADTLVAIRGDVETLESTTALDADVLKKDGSVTPTWNDWDIGERRITSRSFAADTIYVGSDIQITDGTDATGISSSQLAILTADAGAAHQLISVGDVTKGRYVTVDANGEIATSGNIKAATYASDSTVSDTELKYINTLSSNAQDQLNGKQATNTNLTGLSALASTGLVAKTGVGTFTERTITGTADEVDVSNGDGVSGNPTIGLPAAVEITTSLSIANASPTNQLEVTKTAIGVTQSDAYGLRLSNTTAAAAGAQQYSPPLVWRGSGWKTDATAASQKVEFMADVRPVQGAAAPTAYWGLYSSIADAAYSATPILAVTPTGVGIGTTGPSVPLHVFDSNGGDGIRLETSANTAVNMDFISAETSANAIITRLDGVWGSNTVARIGFFTGDDTGNQDDGGIRFFTSANSGNPSTRMTISNSGNVGIGTAAPDGVLELNLGTSGQFRMSYNDADGSATDYAKWEIAADGLTTLTTVDADAAEADIILMPDGNVGIGTTAPGTQTHIYHATNNVDLTLETDKVNGLASIFFTNDAQSWRTEISAGDDYIIRDVTGGNSIFRITKGGPANTLCLDSGNVGIGTTDPQTAMHIVNTTDPQLTVTHTSGADSMTIGVDADGNADLTPSGGELEIVGNRFLDDTPGADHTSRGDIATMTAGTNLTAMQVCFMGSDGKLEKADADAVGTAPAIVMALEAINEDATGDVLMRGFVRDDSWAWTIGDGEAGLIYLSTVEGSLTQIEPSGSGDVIQVIGFATHADRMYFNPSYVLVDVP